LGWRAVDEWEKNGDENLKYLKFQLKYYFLLIKMKGLRLRTRNHGKCPSG
jgi:hypothetical protein